MDTRSSLVGCHSSLRVSTVIMSSFGNALCGLPVHEGERLSLHRCGFSHHTPCARVLFYYFLLGAHT